VIFIENKPSTLRKIPLKELKDKSEPGRKYLQNTYLIKDLYPKY
jgi:hypothetical protein